MQFPVEPLSAIAVRTRRLVKRRGKQKEEEKGEAAKLRVYMQQAAKKETLRGMGDGL